ncbi:MAG: hypothetical protein ABI411_10180 [Tahibacter sp.]
MSGSSSLFASLAQFGGLLFFAALLLLWLRTRSPWLLAGMMASALSLLCRVGFLFDAAGLSQMPVFMGVWQLAGLIEAVCLLGYAIAEYSSARGVRAP